MNGLVLDTHVWIWLIEDDPRLSMAVSDAIETAAGDGAVYIPAVSLWEVAMLVAKGRLSLSLRPKHWMDLALDQPGFALAPLSPEIAEDSCNLPGEFASDPADHLIVATARIIGARLVTHDRKILHYARHGYVKVLPA